MSHTHELMKKGQLAVLKDKRAELTKRFERCKGDLLQYSFPSDPLDPIGSCQLDLVEQAVTDLVKIKKEYDRTQTAIQELGG
jgi:hypothetical protein